MADLRLCDGDKWRESVKVFFELFSTATASERVAGEMERNSVQGNSCSFGYVQFNQVKVYIMLVNIFLFSFSRMILVILLCLVLCSV